MECIKSYTVIVVMQYYLLILSDCIVVLFKEAIKSIQSKGTNNKIYISVRPTG